MTSNYLESTYNDNFHQTKRFIIINNFVKTRKMCKKMHPQPNKMLGRCLLRPLLFAFCETSKICLESLRKELLQFAKWPQYQPTKFVHYCLGGAIVWSVCNSGSLKHQVKTTWGPATKHLDASSKIRIGIGYRSTYIWTFQYDLCN